MKTIRYWVGQIEFIFRLCGLIAIGLYLNVTKGGVTSQIYLCWYISSVRAVSDMQPLYRQLKWHRLSFVNVTLFAILGGVGSYILQDSSGIEN